MAFGSAIKPNIVNRAIGYDEHGSPPGNRSAAVVAATLAELAQFSFDASFFLRPSCKPAVACCSLHG